jgi:nitrous oxide reductase accessory protein NosL
MTVGIAAAILNSWLDGLCRSVTWTEPAAFYVKLHLGDPGSAGTANAAANTTRTAVTFSAASGGAITNSADVAWTNVPNAETYSHVSFWDARTVAIGDNFTIAAGDLDLAITPVAA